MDQIGTSISPDDSFVFKIFKSKLTLNNHGKMSLSEIPHFKFARNNMSKSKPVLEMGCAFGYTTKILLSEGFTVIANDIDQRHLDELEKSVTSGEEKSRLTLRVGNLLDLSFEENSLSGVLGCNVIHFLEGPQIRDLFHRCYKWLAPNGILTFSAAAPFEMYYFMGQESAERIIRDFYSKLKGAQEWPGKFDSKRELITPEEANMNGNVFFRYLPEKLNFLSVEILMREALLAGFNVLKADYFEENENGYQEAKVISKMKFVSIVCVKLAI
jgi:SAM-dependent methyltransferase